MRTALGLPVKPQSDLGNRETLAIGGALGAGLIGEGLKRTPWALELGTKLTIIGPAVNTVFTVNRSLKGEVEGSYVLGGLDVASGYQGARVALAVGEVSGGAGVALFLSAGAGFAVGTGMYELSDAAGFNIGARTYDFVHADFWQRYGDATLMAPIP